MIELMTQTKNGRDYYEKGKRHLNAARKIFDLYPAPSITDKIDAALKDLEDLKPSP
jgi:hypothetical protein